MTTLRITVPGELIMDGIVGIPQVGDRVDYTIQFYEARPWIHPETSNDVVARVESLSEGELSAGWTDPHGRVHPGTYSMLLHGDGWSAYFLSTHFYEGTAELAGSFEADWPGGSSRAGSGSRNGSRMSIDHAHLLVGRRRQTHSRLDRHVRSRA
ncbi:hypothetical protein CA951_13580 [Rhodococcus sp. NCIMB 12038]|nr:hypothetical protein CA951_13580 [Rhodococcus sp. NCIMB 12038]